MGAIPRGPAAFDFAARLEKRLRASEGEAPAVSPSRAGPPPGAVEEALARAEERAALSGQFDPNALFDGALDDAVRTAVLSRLAAACVVRRLGTGVRWTLQSAERARILRRVLGAGGVGERLGAGLPATDAFGQMLRRLLAGGVEAKPDDLSHEDLLALASAVETLKPLQHVQIDEEAIRRAIAKRQFLADYRALLKQGFFGRAEQLEALQAFVQAPDAFPFHGLVVVGLGGAGKSTLMARFAHEVATEALATLVILDFDRPGVDPADTYWLEMEIARQVSCQHPSADTLLREAREANRRLKVSSDQSIQSSSAEAESVARSFRGVVDAVGRAIVAAGADGKPLLVVLDTFEEVAQRELDGKLLDWLRDLAERLGSVSLKVIFSGRLFGRSLARLKSHRAMDELEVGDLAQDDARKLLERLGVESAMAQRLAGSDVLPQRPLELKLLARVVTDRSLGSVEQLEQDLREGGAAARELFTGLVYRRTLLRVSEEARAIAFPGLVLRYLTRELIEAVLVPALELAPMGPGAAQRALDALAGYEWLAYREGDEVWHRKDLRRSTLKAMVGADTARAVKIHARAMEFFSKRLDPRSQMEAVYHRLMLRREPADSLELELLARAAEHIGGDIADLPPAAQSLLRFAAGMTIRVEDVLALPPRHAIEAYAALGARLVSDREFGTAARLIAQFPHPRPEPGPWEVDALFATASWDALGAARPAAKGSDTLRNLAGRLYPAVIVAPDRIDEDEVAYIISELGTSWTDTPTAERNVLLERATLGLLLLHHERPVSEKLREAIGLFVKNVDQLAQRATASRRTPAAVPESVRRRLLLLDLIRRDEAAPERSIGLTPFNVRLDRAWLDQLRWVAGRVGDAKRGAALTRVETAMRGIFARQSQLGVRTFLGEVNGLAKSLAGDFDAAWFTLEEAGGEDSLALARAPDHEFRDPCRYALLGAFGTPDAFPGLGDAFATSVPIDLSDLKPDAFVLSVASQPEAALAVFVELADRSGSLAAVMRRACAARPHDPKLARVTRAYERWISAAEGLPSREYQLA